MKDVLTDSDDDEGFETEDVKVTISTIKPEAYAQKNFIGYRKVQESESEEESEKESPDIEIKDVPGMETTKSKGKPKGITDKAFEKLTEKLKTEKDVKRMVRRYKTRWHCSHHVSLNFRSSNKRKTR